MRALQNNNRNTGTLQRSARDTPLISTPTRKRFVFLLGAFCVTCAISACTPATRDWPTDKDIAPLLQQQVQMMVGASFDGSLSKVVKTEITDIRCNDLAKGKVGCSYRGKVTIHKFARGATTPEVKVLEEKLSGTFVRRGDVWARG